MTDIHSHIIFNVDDGSKSVEESVELLRAMKNTGFDNVIITPHYIADSEYSANNKTKLERLEILKDEVKKANIDICLYLGNEIFISDHIIEDIKNGNVYTLNNSKYLLFELPFHNQILNLADIVYELKVAGFIPILAHPERYEYFQKNYKLVDHLRKEGLLFQCNFASIAGYYHKESIKLMKYMLKKGYVDYLGTDIHRYEKTYTLDEFPKIEKKIIRSAGKDYYKKILSNADKLVNAMPIDDLMLD